MRDFPISEDQQPLKSMEGRKFRKKQNAKEYYNYNHFYVIIRADFGSEHFSSFNYDQMFFNHFFGIWDRLDHRRQLNVLIGQIHVSEDERIPLGCIGCYLHRQIYPLPSLSLPTPSDHSNSQSLPLPATFL